MTDTATPKINDWMTGTYGVTPMSGGAGVNAGTMSGGGMLQAAAPAAAATPASPTAVPAAPAAPAQKVDINSWYRSTLGRDADAAGMAFWQKALDNGGDPQKLYSDFEQAATNNHEKVNNATTWAQANNYTGPQSTDGSSVVDDWGRNVLGRNLSPTEAAQWSAAFNSAGTADNAQKVYQNFLSSMGSQVKNPLDLAGASQISSGLPSSQYQPSMIADSQIAQRKVDPASETVQGRIPGLLAENSPVLQQARAGAMTAANDRGLLNSSIATSGADDAVIRAATGIATTDAGIYNNADDYNVAAKNQALMYNTQAQNSFLNQSQNLDAQALQQDKSTAAQAQLQAQQLANQMSLQQLQSEVTKWTTTANNTQSAENTRQNLINAIIQNIDISPDRKAAMLEQLGAGTSAANGKPGTGLAGAVYVIDSTTADLVNRDTGDPSHPNTSQNGAGSYDSYNGTVG